MRFHAMIGQILIFLPFTAGWQKSGTATFYTAIFRNKGSSVTLGDSAMHMNFGTIAPLR